MTGGLARLADPDAQGVRWLVLDRADKANALSEAMVDAMHGCLDAIGPETRALAIRGEGRNFCAGFDFAGCEEQSEGDLLLRFVRINELLERLRSASYPTLAWVHGAAFGAGADIACACAFRVGTAAARFRFPGFQFGIALGTRRLATIVGPDRARTILLRNEELDAQAALRCGLLGDLLEDADPSAAVHAMMSSAGRLDAASVQALNTLTDAGDAHRDLAELVRSAARRGLHERIRAYRARAGASPGKTASA